MSTGTSGQRNLPGLLLHLVLLGQPHREYPVLVAGRDMLLVNLLGKGDGPGDVRPHPIATDEALVTELRLRLPLGLDVERAVGDADIDVLLLETRTGWEISAGVASNLRDKQQLGWSG